MKRIPYTIAVFGAVIVVSLVMFGFEQSQTEQTVKQENTMSVANLPIALPKTLVGFPDVERVPIYPGATVTFSSTEATNLTNITYEVGESIVKVGQFYAETLPRNGWVLGNSSDQASQYNWTDPEGKVPWQLHLDVVIGSTFDNSRTTVELEYGRYPKAEDGLPVYLNAQQVSITHSNVVKRFPSGETPVKVTDVSYVSSANARDIATFYSSSMQDYGWYEQGTGWSTDEYGWYPFDETGSWVGRNPREGLHFVASRPRWDGKSGVVSAHLLASSTLQEDGRVLVKLHVEEYETSLGNF